MIDDLIEYFGNGLGLGWFGRGNPMAFGQQIATSGIHQGPLDPRSANVYT
jgi:hypothetical protein